MRVLQVHNYYRERGGEDVSFDADRALLAARGYAVDVLTRHSDELETFSPAMRAGAALGAVWSRRTYRDCLSRIDALRPDVVHVHNFMPLISPSVFYACRARGVPVVCTLRNFRLICPGALLLRNNVPCDQCVARVPWAGVRYACYRRSVPQSCVVFVMLMVHRALRTWHRAVDRYIVASAFAGERLQAGGLPGERIVVRANAPGEDPGPGRGPRQGAVYAGRLSAEKGVDLLIDAWAAMPELSLTLYGDGPLRGELEQRAARAGLRNVHFAGAVEQRQVLEAMQQAELVVMPSLCYETFGRVIVEAYACATPVLAAGHGSMAELVEDGRTGLLFAPGNLDALRDALRRAVDNSEQLRAWGVSARRRFDASYSAPRCMEALESVYEGLAGKRVER